MPQFPIIRDATRAFNLPCIEMQGFEADDIIATYAAQARDAGGRVTIISSDKDLMQLVGGGVEMLDPMKNKRIGIEEVEEKFGVGPDRVVDVQALAGDSVDNVPGAPGIGVKTAALLINEYGDLEALLARAEEIKQPKRRQTLIDNVEQIRTSRELVLLRQDLDMPEAIEDFELREPEAEVLLPFLAEMEFGTLLRRIAAKLGAEAPEIKEAKPEAHAIPTLDVSAGAIAFDHAKYETVTDAAALKAWIEKIYVRGWVAFDTETTGLDEMRVGLVGVSLSVEPGRACYVPMAHVAGEGDLFGSAERAEGQMDFAEALAILKPMLEDASIVKIGQNMKYDMKIMARNGVVLGPIEDTMLMSYALNGGVHRHGMDELSTRYLGHTPIPIKGLIGTGKSAITFDKVAISEASPYAAEDADITLRLWQVFKPRLVAEGMSTVYHTLERPLVPVLARNGNARH